MSGVQLLVGLGNPGSEYHDTRHNVGFWLLDQLALSHHVSFRQESKFHGEICKITVNGATCWLLKPTTFMNRSGLSVASVVRFYKIPLEHLLVVHDDLDFAPGVVRLKSGGGLGGHNGLKDIVQNLQSQQFWRLRLGIGRPKNSQQVSHYVLKPPQHKEYDLINEAIQQFFLQLDAVFSGDFQAVMNQLHKTA